MTMQKITFSDYIRIQINQTGLKQIFCVGATVQTPTPLPRKRIKRNEQVKNEREGGRGRHSLSNLSILIHLLRGSSLQFQPEWEGVIKYAFSNPEEKKYGDREAALQHCSTQFKRSHNYGWKRYLNRRKRKARWKAEGFEKTLLVCQRKKGLCSFKSQVLLSPLSNIFYFTSPEKK